MESYSEKDSICKKESVSNKIEDPLTYNVSLIIWARVKKDEGTITHANSSNMGLKYKSESI